MVKGPFLSDILDHSERDVGLQGLVDGTNDGSALFR